MGSSPGRSILTGAGAIAGGLIGGLVGGPAGAGFGYQAAMLGAGYGAAGGGLFGGMLFPPPKPQVKIRQVKSIVGTSAVEGVPVAVIFGRTRVGGSVMFKSNVVRHETTQVVSSSRGGGKGGGGGGGGAGSTETQTVSTFFTSDIIIALGEGPLILHKIYEGKTVVTPSYTFYPGTFTQDADSFLTTESGSEIAYRGTSYIVFRDYNLGSSSTLPALTFEVERGILDLSILEGQTGSSANYLSWNPVAGTTIDSGLGSSLIQCGYETFNYRDYIPGWSTHAGLTTGMLYNRTDNLYTTFDAIGDVNIHDAGSYLACSAIALTNSVNTLNYRLFNSDLTEAGNEIVNPNAIDIVGMGSGRGVVYTEKLSYNAGLTVYEELAGLNIREEEVNIVATKVVPDNSSINIYIRTQNYHTPLAFGTPGLTAGFPAGSLNAWALGGTISTTAVEASFFDYNDSVISLLSDGSVYQINPAVKEDYSTSIGPWVTVDYGTVINKINTNDLIAGSEIGGATKSGSLIYAGYTDGVGTHSTGSVAYFDLLTRTWSSDVTTTAAVVEKQPASSESQATKTFHVPIFHDGNTIYYGKNTTSNTELWQMYKTRDNFVTTSVAETHQHGGTGLFGYNDNEWAIRPLGIAGSTLELSTTPFNDIVYSHGTPVSYSLGGTTHELITTAEAINEVITSPRYGGNFSKVTNHLIATQDCRDNNYYLNTALTERRDISSVLGILSSHGWISPIFSGAGIKLLVGKSGAATKTLDSTDVLGGGKVINVAESGNSERINRIHVEFTDPVKEYSSRPVLVEDLADQELRGIHKSTLALPGFVDRDVVKNIGSNMLRSSLFSRRMVAFSLGQEHLDLEVGDVVTLDFEEANLRSTRSRVVNIAETEEFNLDVLCKEEPTYIFDPVDYEVPATSILPDKPITAGLSTVVAFDIKETPFELLTKSGVLEMAVLYARTNADTVGIDLYWSTDSGVSYELLLESRHNPPVGFLKTNMDTDFWLDDQEIDIDITGLTDNAFTSATREQMFSGINSIIIDDEYMLMQNASLKDANTYTLSDFIRGRHGTETKTHIAGSTVYHLHTVDNFTIQKGKIGTTLFFKAVPINYLNNAVDISDVEAIEHRVLGRSFRPHPPSSVGLVENGVNKRSKEKTLELSPTINWKLVNKQTGFGRQGYGFAVKEGTPLGEEYVDVVIDVYASDVLVRTTVLGVTHTDYIYPEADNITDNGTFDPNLEFKVYSRGAYGRSIKSTDKVVTIIQN
jgi:hypothetical protein